MRRHLVLATLSTLALAVFASTAAAQKKTMEVTVSGRGNACRSDAEKQAMTEVLGAIAKAEPEMASEDLQCVVDRVKPAKSVELKAERSKKTPDGCDVTFAVRYERPEVLKADRACRSTKVRVPVGVVLRAENDGKADPALAQQAIGRITEELDRANFEIVSLQQFQQDFNDLKMLVGQCAFTGASSQPEWTEDCKQRFASYGAARDALSLKIAEAVVRTPSLKRWRTCGGLFLAGEVRLSGPGQSRQSIAGQIDVDYYALADTVTFIAPFADARTSPIDLGGAAMAAQRALAQVAGAAATDATKKLARFAHSRGCAASQD